MSCSCKFSKIIIEDRDEIRVGSADGGLFLYAAFDEPQVEQFEGAADYEVRCPRCRLQLKDGDHVVRCPACHSAHHTLAGAPEAGASKDDGRTWLPCDVYADECGGCERLRSSMLWQPEELDEFEPEAANA